MTIHTAHQRAIDSAVATFGEARVVSVEQPDGTTLVTVTGVDIGEGWAPATVSLTVLLTVTFPTTPPYPYYVDDRLGRVDSGVPSNVTHGAAVAGGIYSQVSLSNREMRADETLGERLIAAIAWFKSQ